MLLLYSFILHFAIALARLIRVKASSKDIICWWKSLLCCQVNSGDSLNPLVRNDFPLALILSSRKTATYFVIASTHNRSDASPFLSSQAFTEGVAISPPLHPIAKVSWPSTQPKIIFANAIATHYALG